MPSIERRQTRDGVSWRIRYRHRGQHKALTFNTEAAATKWAATMDAHGVDVALAILEHVDSKAPTVASQVAQHIDNLTGVTDGTRHRYRAYLTRDIETQPLGHTPLDRVSEDTVKQWVNGLAGRGLSGKSIRNIHALVSTVMTNAHRRGIIATNPAKGIRLPQTMKVEHVFLTRDEFARIVQLTPEHYQPLVLTLGMTGMRIGEATALRVSDVDLTLRRIHIRRAWKHTGTSTREIGLPKTRKSLRTVAFPAVLGERLEPLVVGRKPNEWLFVNVAGNPVIAKSFHDDPWTRTVEQFAGDTVVLEPTGGRPRRVVSRGDGRRPRVHDLRHSFAGWMIESGAGLPALQRHLGHESIQTTVDIYGSVQRADLDALAELVAVDVALGALEA